MMHIHIENQVTIQKGVQRAKPFAGAWGRASGGCNSGLPHHSPLSPAAGGGTIRILEELLNQMENLGSCVHDDTGRESSGKTFTSRY